MISDAALRDGISVSGPNVATSAHPAAAAAAIATFSRGGNAFDAALAACFVETIALPMKCGLAGDVVALFRRAGDGELRALVSVGPGATALAAGARLERLGPRSVGIPGAPDGYTALHRFARLPLSDLVAPAVRAGERGVAWTRVSLSYLKEAEALLKQHNKETVYMPDGRMPEVGELLKLPGLGALLERFAASGAALFEGSDGERLVAKLKAGGGLLRMEDFKARPARIAEPETAELGGALLIGTPRPTGGARLIDVMQQAVKDRGALVDIVRAERKEAKARGRLASDGGTSVVTAADSEGNAVVLVHSNSFPRFGSGVVLDDGLVLNNRPGRGFDLEAPASAANGPAPGRVPQTTLHAWALRRGEELLMGATPGGVNQLPWNAQTLLDLHSGASIAEAVSNPRWALDDADELTAEAGVGLPAGTSGLRSVGPSHHRSVEQIIRLPTAGLLEAAADPRCAARALASY